MKNKYKVSFTFTADHKEECPFYEWSSTFDPKTKKSKQHSYCRIFGVRSKCHAITLGDSGFPKWCPISIEKEYNE